MLLAASLTVLLRLPQAAPERPEKEEPAPAAAALLEPLRNRRFRRVMLTNMVWSLSGILVHRRLCRGVPDSGAGTDVFEIMVWVTAGKMNDVNSLSHSSWNCKYHVVFAPKYRRKVFFGEKRRN